MGNLQIVLGVLALAVAAASAVFSGLAVRMASRADKRVAAFTGPMFEPSKYVSTPVGVVLEVTNVGGTVARDVAARLANGEIAPDTVVALEAGDAFSARNDIVKVGSSARFFLSAAGAELSEPRTARYLLGSIGLTHALVSWTDPDGTRRATSVRLPMLGEESTS